MVFALYVTFFAFFQLRQYRQKKDGKGKDGKGSGRSTNKVDRPGKFDADVDKGCAVLKVKAESSKLPEAEVESNSSVPATVKTVVDSSIYSLEDLEVSEGAASNFHVTDQFVLPAADVGEQAVLDVPFDAPGSNRLLGEASTKFVVEHNVPNGKGQVDVAIHEGPVAAVSSALEILHGDLVTLIPHSTSGTACNAEAVAEALIKADVSLEVDKVLLVSVPFVFFMAWSSFPLFNI